jgi:hypothetical protein
MVSTQLLRTEIGHYQILGEQLKSRYCEIDDETLQGTLEGITALPELILALIRSSLEDEAFITALKTRIDEMGARANRLKVRFEKKRSLACWAMTSAGIERLNVEDFSLSLRQGPPRLEVTEETQVPTEFFIPQPSRLDRAGLIAALKRGNIVPGAILVNGDQHIAVRVQ